MIELALMAVMALGTPGGDGSVRGTILSDQHEPVAGVQVELPALNRVTWSDDTGRYELAGLEPGEHEIRFTRFAYDPLILTVAIPTGHALDLDVRLRTRFVVQPGISVLAAVAAARRPLPFPSGGLPEVGSREIPVEAIWSSPLVGQPDVLAALRTVPGIDLAEENATQVHVRGGSADQNLVLLDGAPVYNGYHNSGILSAVTPDALSSMVVHTGVMPARYGGRLSSVVDLRTRAPPREGVAVQGGLGVPDVRLAIQVPLSERAGVLLAGRRTTYDLVRRAYTRGTKDSGFEDVLGKLETGLLGGTFSVVALHTDNWLSSAAGSAEDGQDAVRFTDGFPDLHNSVGWSSGTDAFTWTRPSNGSAELELKLFRSASRANIEWGSLDVDHRMHSRLVHWGGSVEASWLGATSDGRAGLSVESLSTEYRTAGSGLGGSLPGADYALAARPAIVASWLERRWIPRDDWLVNGGLRAIHVEGAGPGLEPRLSAHYRPNDRMTISAGWGRVHQVLQSLANEESLLNAAYAVEPLIAAGAGGVPLARSDQLAAAIETKLAERFRLAVDGYVRWMENLVLVAPGTAEPYATGGFDRGRGESHGMGAELVYGGDRLDARAVADWSSAERTVGHLTYHPGFERRRSLALEAAYRLFRGTTLTSAFQLAAGRPTSPLGAGFDWDVFDQLTGEVEFRGTPARIDGPLNADRLPPYARLDLGLRQEWQVQGRGTAGTISTYLDILNVLDHENVLGRQLPSPGTPARPLVLMPRSLLFGVEWRF